MAKKIGQAYKMPKPSLRMPKPKMTYNKRLLKQMKLAVRTLKPR